MQSASRKARASGEKRIAARDIRKVTLVSEPCHTHFTMVDGLSDRSAQIQRMIYGLNGGRLASCISDISEQEDGTCWQVRGEGQSCQLEDLRWV